jgi:5-methylthioadenosine/S-adenosylhomocysteine deaminase
MTSWPKNTDPARRNLLKGLAAAPLLALAEATPQLAFAADANTPVRKSRTLIKGGYVATLEKATGDIAQCDVLIEGSRIAAIGRGLSAADADVVDASGCVVLPGLIDTHRHTWQTSLRSYLAKDNYYQIVLTQLGPLYRPEDVYIGNLLGSIGALNSGITTMLDWSHIINSPAHADAAIQGLSESGIRGVFAHGVAQVGKSAGATLQANSQKHSTDIRRVKKQFFSSDDQLLTLAMACGGIEFSSLEETRVDFAMARDLGIRMTTHVGVLPNFQAVTKMKEAGLLGPDLTHVHASLCSDDELKMIADSGGDLSSSPLNERLTGISRWLKAGLRPSLSLDNETRAPGDLFAQMRAILWHEWNYHRDARGAAVIDYRDVLEFATIQGAKSTGLDKKTGTLAIGKRADVILVDRNDVSMIPSTGDPVSGVVLIAQPGNVSWVFVDGKVRKRNGKLVDVDVNRLQRLAQASHDYLIRAGNLKPQS